MATITIPSKIIGDEELIAIPRKKYERFLRLERGKQKAKNMTELAVEEGLRDLREGRVHGPFSSIRAFKKYLKNAKKRNV